MAKKPWVIGGVLSCCAVTFILIGAVLPVVVNHFLRQEIIKSTVLSDRSLSTLGGKIPGDTHDVMLHEYHFGSVENPDDVLYQGAVPILTEMNGYIYQEFDEFLNIEYTDYQGTDKAWVHFFLNTPIVYTDHCKWRNNTKPTDKVMTISLGSWGAWDQMKHTPPETIALAALYQIALGLNTALALASYTQGVAGLFPTYKGMQTYVYNPAEINAQLG